MTKSEKVHINPRIFSWRVISVEKGGFPKRMGVERVFFVCVRVFKGSCLKTI